MKSLICLLAVLLAASFASASIIEVGTGANTVGVEIEWKDGFLQEFAVSFDTAYITGWEAMNAIETETSLALVVQDYGWGDFIDGISFDEHSNVGYISGDDWWHFWIKDVGQDWISPAYGISDRVLLPGDSDGWVYGHEFAPGEVPEPATMALLAIGGLLIRKRR